MTDDQLNQEEEAEIYKNLSKKPKIPNEDNNMNSGTETLGIDNYINHPKPLNNGNFFDSIDELNSRQESDLFVIMNASLIPNGKKDGLPINENNESEIYFLKLIETSPKKPLEQSENKNEFLDKKRNRENEEKKNSTENENKLDINEIHKIPKEETPRCNIMELENKFELILDNSVPEYNYKSQIFQILIALVEKDNISDFTKMMNEKFKNILNPENQENFSFLDKKLLDYFNEFFESIQKNDITGNSFKKKKRNIEEMFGYIKVLNNKVKEMDLKKEKEKEKEEKKETKEYIILYFSLNV